MTPTTAVGAVSVMCQVTTSVRAAVEVALRFEIAQLPPQPKRGPLETSLRCMRPLARLTSAEATAVPELTAPEVVEMAAAVSPMGRVALTVDPALEMGKKPAFGVLGM